MGFDEGGQVAETVGYLIDVVRGAKEDDFGFGFVELKEVFCQPGLYFNDAVKDIDDFGLVVWIEGEVELGVVSVAVERDIVFLDNLAEGKHVDGEENGTQD